MQSKYTIAAVVLAAAVALTGGAEAGKFSGIFNPGSGSSSNAGNLGDILKEPGKNAPDFDGIFNPEPKPVISKHIDLDPPKPVIYKYIDLGFGKPGAAGGPGSAPGGLVDYRRVAKINPGLKLNCAVAGTPVEFPDDLVIANAGLIEVPAGSKIQWQVAVAGQDGIAILAKTLKPGKSVKLNGVLAGGVQIGTPCAITAIGH